MADYGMLRRKAHEIRTLTLETIGHVGKGHLGGCMSLCEVMSVLYFSQMNVRPEDPQWKHRDRFILSKGHAGPVVYSALALRGYFDREALKSLNELGTSIPSHCDATRTAGVDVTTGSLGQGFSVAVGLALAAKLDREALYVYPIIGDGESQEGLVWEAAMLAGNKGLDNIIGFTDYNNLQIDGHVSEVNGLEPLADKWAAFGWDVQSVDGHDVEEIDQAVSRAKQGGGKPHMIILRTVKGKGISFAENVVTNHSMTISKDVLERELKLLRGEGECDEV